MMLGTWSRTKCEIGRRWYSNAGLQAETLTDVES